MQTTSEQLELSLGVAGLPPERPIRSVEDFVLRVLDAFDLPDHVRHRALGRLAWRRHREAMAYWRPDYRGGIAA